MVEHTLGEITHIDFSEETTKLILKVVVINFAVLAACSLFWFFGIGALVVYSIVLFFIIKKHYEQINKDYHAMLDAMQTIAEGNLDQEIQGILAYLIRSGTNLRRSRPV